MQEFKTLLEGKPAIVTVNDDGCVHVASNGRTWGFDRDLRPQYIQTDNSKTEMVFTFRGGKVLSGIRVGEHEPRMLGITNNNGYLGTFKNALDAISASSPRKPLPPEVKDKLIGAYKLLGVDGPAKG